MIARTFLRRKMRLVFLRTKIESTVFPHTAGWQRLTRRRLAEMKISAKAGSSSKNIILALHERGLIESFEEWKFWAGPERTLDGEFPVRLFPCDSDSTSEAMARWISKHGAPDVLWVEGPDHPPYLQQLFELCPSSFKMVYSKDWRPHKIERLERYQLCLVDEDRQVKKVHKYFPGVRCGVWDKLIDYERTHFPLREPKIYDVCYIAYLRRRKRQELLLWALAEIQDRRLKGLLIGSDRKGYRRELEQLAANLGVDIEFTGEVSKAEVNRLVNRSKVGVLCARDDAAPRAILEYMAADVPVVVNAALQAGTKYVGPEAGVIVPPDRFHLGILEVLDRSEHFHPRAHLLANYSREKVLAKFIDIWREAGLLQRSASRSAVAKKLAGA